MFRLIRFITRLLNVLIVIAVLAVAAYIWHSTFIFLAKILLTLFALLVAFLFIFLVKMARLFLLDL